MDYAHLKKRDLEKIEIFLKSLEDDFLQSRKIRKRNPLERYIDNLNLRMIIAKDRRNIMGYISYEFNVRGAGKIIGIGVSKNYRGKGIGEALFKRALKELSKKHKRIITRTWSTNTTSRSLIEKMGFKKYRVIKNKRIDGSDDVWLSRNR
ncbi:MAG: GNAT family N-acetyltransferase [Candidatus Woesearchaeota archaeon]|nr:GNAT family N-acetyltransferase [Candidatus Woesearchaeota archaeon]